MNNFSPRCHEVQQNLPSLTDSIFVRMVQKTTVSAILNSYSNEVMIINQTGIPPINQTAVTLTDPFSFCNSVHSLVSWENTTPLPGILRWQTPQIIGEGLSITAYWPLTLPVTVVSSVDSFFGHQDCTGFSFSRFIKYHPLSFRSLRISFCTFLAGL